MDKTEQSHHVLSGAQREGIDGELTAATERMLGLLKLMRAVYVDASQEISRAEQIVNAIARLKRQLSRNDTKNKSAIA